MTATCELPTRQRILQAAEPLFAEHGFAGVSMRAIAAAAGVHLGQLPYHFGTKDALYREIWDYWFGQVEAAALLAERQSNAQGSKRKQLRAVVEAFFDGPRRLLSDNRGRHFVAIMVREAHDPASGTRGLLEQFIFPNGNKFRDELARLFPSMDTIARDAGFEMILAALRVVIERGRPSQLPPDEAMTLFNLLTQFVVNGWMAMSVPTNHSID